MRRNYINFIALLLLWGVSSCAKEWEGGQFKPQEGNSEVVLTIKTPAGFSSGGATRGLTVAQETQIDNIWVLVFSEATKELTGIAQGTNIKPVEGSSSSTFTVSVKESSKAKEKYILMVLANAQTIIENTITTDIHKVTEKGYTDVIAKLNEAITGKIYKDGGVIPMWGQSSALEIRQGLNKDLTLSMVRSVARIDVGVGRPEVNNGMTQWNGKNATGGVIPFEIKELYIVQPNNMYAVVPTAVTDNKVSEPTLPKGVGKFTIDESIAHFSFTDGTEITPSSGDWGSYTTQAIYIPEADIKMGENAKSGDVNHVKRMAVVVGGLYKGGTVTSYYRLDFANDGDILNVLRNHLYQFNISKVSSAGYADVESAYKSLSVNMQAEILAWDDAVIGDIVLDGQYYFSIEKPTIEFTPLGNETQTLTIKTNVEGFEMVEIQGDKSEVVRLKANRTNAVEYNNPEMFYHYKLSYAAGDIYTLTIQSQKHNVSEEKPNRKNNWRIKVNRLNATFAVNQQYTNLYVSYVNGESKTLFPEGTTDKEKIKIDILALVPVKIEADSWIDVGIKDVPNVNGLYSALIDAKVNPYLYNGAVMNDRVGKITVTPQGEEARVFTITQQAPYIRLASTVENILRMKTEYTYKNQIKIETNIPTSDLHPSRSAGTGNGIDRIQSEGTLYHVDDLLPRNVRLNIEADMTNNTSVLPTTEFSADFTIAIDAKYGPIPPQIIKYKVENHNLVFKWNWVNGLIIDPSTYWTASSNDSQRQYIFPWQMKELTYNVTTTLGVEDFTTHSGDMRHGGTLTKGVETTNDEGHDVVPFIFTFENSDYTQVKDYAFYFKTNNLYSIERTDSVLFKQGSQLWSKSPVGGELSVVGYKGTGQPIKLDITNNVAWRVFSDVDWLQMRTAPTDAWSQPTAANPLTKDDRLRAPVIYEANNPSGANAKATIVTPLYFSIPSWTDLNPTEASRVAAVAFQNDSYSNTKSGAELDGEGFGITQYAPVLEYQSGAPPGNISPAGNTYWINVSTNLQSWGVRVYEGTNSSGTLINTFKFGSSPTISDKVATTRTVKVGLPRTTKGTNSQNRSFYLFHDENAVTTKEVLIGSFTQEGFPNYTPKLLFNIKWATGNLVSDGMGGCRIGDPTDCGLYFSYGSLVGWNGGENHDGTGVPSKDIPQVQTVSPTGYGGSAYWPSAYTKSGGIVSKDDPAGGIGDPCRYYLGDAWRLPEFAELSTLFGGFHSWREWAKSPSGNWVKDPNIGAWGGPDAKKEKPENAIFLSASGWRDEVNGAHIQVSEAGSYASSGVAATLSNVALTNFYEQAVTPVHQVHRAQANSIRCVTK